MSLIACPECGKSVSSEAPAYPSCGYPIKPAAPPVKKNGLLWGLGLLLAVPALFTVVAIVGLLAAIAIPSFVKARSTSQLHVCSLNLQRIEAAKQSWALAHAATTGAEVDVAAVKEALETGMVPFCPAGGRYSLHQVGMPPECSVHGVVGHTHPPGN